MSACHSPVIARTPSGQLTGSSAPSPGRMSPACMPSSAGVITRPTSPEITSASSAGTGARGCSPASQRNTELIQVDYLLRHQEAPMNPTGPPARAGVAAQLHDAARAARQVAADRETSPPSALPGPAIPGPRTDAPIMPAEPAASQQPSHPLHALSARDLRDYRRDLEQALNGLPAHAPVRDLLHRSLAEVRAEQEARAQTASPPSTDTRQ